MKLLLLASLALQAPTPPAAPAAAPSDTAPQPAAPAPSVLPAPTKPRLLVLELVDKGAGPEITNAVSQAVAGQALQSFTLGEVITQQQIKVALDASSTQALLGCESAQCMTDVGKTVEAATILGGSVAKVGDDVLVSILVVNARDGSRVAERQQKVPVSRELYYYAARQLTSLALTGRTADPRVPVEVKLGPDDAGDATFIVDGKEVAVGQSTKVDLDPGSHEIRVRMGGKAEWKTLVSVEEATPVRLVADLVDTTIALWPIAIGTGVASALAFGGFAYAGLVATDGYEGSIDVPLPFFGTTKEDSYVHKEPVDSAGLYAKETEVGQASLVANIFAGSAAVLGAATVALIVTELVLNATAE
jgi:TolB-like protein